MKKRILSLLLAAALLLGLTPAFAAGRTPFADVPAGAWYADAVAELNDLGYVNGVSASAFDPDGSMTRAMVVTILSRMGGGVSGIVSDRFADVPADAWYAQAVAWAAANRITNGVDDDHFNPDGVITREMLATLLWRYAEMRYEYDYFDRFYAEQAFDDDDPVSDWAQLPMRLSIGSHVLQGRATENGVRWAAQDTCTRAEAVTMLHRFLQLELTGKEPIVSDDADRIADVSLKLFRAAEEPGKNIVVSPLSMIYALAMLNNGASGETKAQLEALFGCDAETLTDTLAAYAKTLPTNFSGKVRLANSVWLRDGVAVKPEFVALNRDRLGAEVFQRSFDRATLQELNGWVSEQTDGMIPSILSDLPQESWIVLVNALLFQGKWSQEYKGTTPMDFHAADGTVQKADMLRGLEFCYLHDENAEGFLKGMCGHYAFAVVLPKEGMTPAEYLATLDGASLRSLLQYELYDEVHTTMPKFKTEYSSDLMPIFRAAGLTNLSELDGIAPEAFVSDAVHKAVIDVNEDGVSAAAVTAIDVAGSALIDQPKKIANIVADRPYIYMIVDTTTNLPLFIGVNESI